MSNQTPEQIRQHLADGSAAKRFIIQKEAWYFDAASKPLWERQNIVAEIRLGVDAMTKDGEEDGTLGEWSLEWNDFTQVVSRPNIAMRLKSYSDSWAALLAVGFPGLMESLATEGEDEQTTPEIVVALLVADGWVDATPRVSPYGYRTPDQGQEG